MSRVCIGIASRDRPRMVAELLSSIGRLETAAEMDIILVENGDGEMLRPVVDGFAASHARFRIHHLAEPRLGIVFARNAVLEFALKSGFDSLAFVDDDEVVTPDWMAEIVAEQQRGAYDIIGGPVRAFVRSSPLRFWERIVWKGLSARFRQVEQKSADRKSGDRDADVVVATNNCLLNLEFIRKQQLRFNEQYNLTGGEDTRFFHDARALGAKTGWAPRAVVLEEMPRERLSPLYQIRRARSHALVSFHDKFDGRPVYKWLHAPVSAALKLLSGLVLLVLAPFTSGATFFNALRAFGEAAGRAQGLMGARRALYSRTTGG
jgi:glycosyltransferase involved in cell wall biosynthesis